VNIEVTRSTAPFGHADSLFIDGAWTRPETDAMIEVISPSTEEVFTRVAEASESDVNKAVNAARRAFDDGPWPRMSHQERASYVRALGDELAKRGDAITAAWTGEMGIIRTTAEMFLGGATATYGYYADLAATFPFEEPHQPTAGGEYGLLVREPVGVVGIIIPWNFPVNLLSSKLAPALVAGCTTIVKSSPEAPSIGYILADAAQAAGIPAGVINTLTADRAVSEALVRHPDVDKIAFTGSTAAGRQIGSICGGRIARFTLELGGKSAAVILDDYDVQAAADALAGPTCFANGQVCSALTRIIVSKTRHDQLVDALSDRFASVRIGDPFDASTELGPVAMRRQRDRIEGLIATGQREGAKLAAGGGRPAQLNRGFFLEPTVFANVDNDMTIAREELFGPVLCVIPAQDDEQAVRIANDTIYGLNNSVFTNDPERAYQVARRLRSGTVGHNAFRTDFGIAFGGFKQSGVGREGGVEGLRPYLESKTVILEGVPSHLRG
jgi:betaine-aldehyde dehydrogenase